MNTSKIIKGVVGGGRYTVTAPITQWDYGYIFQPIIEDLPATYRLDFSNDEHSGTAYPVYCGADGGEVPQSLIDTGKDIFVWLFYIGEDFGKSTYKWRIPNKLKPQTSEDEPTPSQQSSIDQLIVRSNEAVERAEDAQQAIEDMSVSATTLAAGSSATVTKTESGGVVHLEFGIPRGADGGGGGGADLYPATKYSLGGIIVGEDLQVTSTGLLSVVKANAVEQDNTHPITAAAVYTEVGNINALLQTI